MCGIAGVISLENCAGIRTRDCREIVEMIGLVGHRGPDDLRYYADDRVALAAARLSIIDLDHGRQPMRDPSGRFLLVFNGEIYNYIEIREALERCGHVFNTRSDTEVVLRAWIEWKENAFARFDGGFAMAIYDRIDHQCILARDRYGKRPLFYGQHNGSLLFASEMKAFLAWDGFSFHWDMKQLNSIATIWTPIGDETGFKGIKQLPSGSTLTISNRGRKHNVYASLPLPATHTSEEPADALERLRYLLSESVKLRLRSDVDVAVFVSGGLDSTIVTKLTHDRLPKVRTYSVQFEDPLYDETADQRAATAYFKLENSAVTVSAGTIADAFPQALWHAEVPQFRTAFVPMYLLGKRVKEDGIKVVLSGEGADEVFFGYDIFKETILRANWNNIAPDRRRSVLQSLYPYMPHFSRDNLPSLSALFARTSSGAGSALFSHQIRFDNSALARRLLSEQCSPLESLERAVSAVPRFAELTNVRRAQWLEFHTLLQGYLLSAQSDRALFAHGVEPRCPFLSPSVVEFAASLPDSSLLAPNYDEKNILKRAFRNDLPQRALSKPKWPYRAPDISSFLAPRSAGQGLSDWTNDVLSADNLRIGILDSSVAQRLVEKVNRTPPEEISPRENQAFILLLSLVLLNDQFVRRRGLRSYSDTARRAALVEDVAEPA